MKYIKKINESKLLNKDLTEYYQIIVDEFSDDYQMDISRNGQMIIISTRMCDIVENYVKLGRNVNVAIENIDLLKKAVDRYQELLVQVKHVEENLIVDNIYYDIKISDLCVEIFVTSQNKA